MKKIISLILALTLTFSVLPTAFAANIGKTTEGMKKGKVVFHVDDDLTGYRQSLVETLDEALSNFLAKQYYCPEVWNEAQKLYSDEVERIYSLTEIDELIEDGFFGPSANETTMSVYEDIYALSMLNKTVVKKASDLPDLKNKLKNEVNKLISASFKRADYTDYYWDMFTLKKEEAIEEIENVSSFTEYARAMFKFPDEFEDYTLDYDSEIEEFLDKEILNIDEMTTLANLYSDEIYTVLETIVDLGYKEDRVYSDKVYDAIDEFYSKADKAQYAGEIQKEAEKTLVNILSIIGITSLEDKEQEPATISFKKRLVKKVENIFYSFSKSDYTENGWARLESIESQAVEDIYGAEFKNQIGTKFMKEVEKNFKEVPTLASELKEAKKLTSDTLKKYLGNKKYNQTKAKKLVNEGLKKINSAKTPDDVYALCDKYVKALEKTVNVYKISVTKSGKGSVTKSATVKYGKNFTVKIVPAAGFKIKSIVVDGKKVKLTNAYTFKKVTKAHSIKVTFGR